MTDVVSAGEAKETFASPQGFVESPIGAIVILVLAG
jgi:hypothetical protein